MQKYRLHEIEGAVELFSSDPFVFRPAELYQIKGDLRKAMERYNLYLVARRPRMSLIPSSLILGRDGESVTGTIEAQVGAVRNEIRFKTFLPAPLQAAQLGEHKYPFDYLHFYTPDGTSVHLRLHDVLRFSDVPKSSLTDMQVEYVGQAFGDAGERDVVDRLIGNTGKVGHGSLQKVLAEVNANHPDQEVHLLLYSFEFHKRHIILGGFLGQPEPRHSIDSAPNRFEQFFETEIGRNIRIDLAEAALIRYFAPAYNDIYKKTFPTETHKILDRLHELDITGLAVSLSTLEHNIRVVSKRAAPSDAHCATFPITTDQNRLSFLELATPGGE
ncbi:hypothetical protein ACWYXO_15385 [Janthinobacterium aestuarii]